MCRNSMNPGHCMSEELLAISDLVTVLDSPRGSAAAVDGVDMVIHSGETLGVVGESGCGKTMLALSILKLIPTPPARISRGSVKFRGRELMDMDENAMRSVRGNEISMIFQEPMTSLNPVFTVGEQIGEALRLHQGQSKRQSLEVAADMLGLVGISAPGSAVKSYPHELSGGMRQRVIIAMALACDPDLILADEPTTALDVTIQDQILELMLDLQRKKGAAIMMITHDLGVVAQTCEHVVVMYAGKVVESSPVNELFAEPAHPYTKGLLHSLPVLRREGAKRELTPIPGVVPGLWDLPRGCAFHPRCSNAFERCKQERPPLIDLEGGRKVRCWLYA